MYYNDILGFLSATINSYSSYFSTLGAEFGEDSYGVDKLQLDIEQSASLWVFCNAISKF